MHQKENPNKPPTKVKITRVEMHTTLENKKKVVANSPKNVIKRKNKVEEGGTLGSRVNREHKSTEARAHKMMRGRVDPSTIIIVVSVVLIVVQAAIHIAKVPQMTSP